MPLHLIARNQFKSIEKVGRLGMPKLFIHGSEDPTVPIEHGRRLFEAAASPKEWYEVPRAGHSDSSSRWAALLWASAAIRTPVSFLVAAIQLQSTSSEAENLDTAAG